MSFDLYFVNSERPFHESMELLEQRATGLMGELSAEELALWDQVLHRVRTEIPGVTVAGDKTHVQLEDPLTLAKLSLFAGGELSATVPYWYDQCCTGAARGAALATYASAVESVTGLIAFDPQVDGRFSQYSVQWFDHDRWQGELVTFVSPDPTDMTMLRKMKDQGDRRSLAYRIASNAADDRVVHSTRDAVTWLAECAITGPEPYMPKRDQVALRYGQQMHKRNGFRLDVIRNVPDLLPLLTASSDEQLHSDILAMKTPEFLDAKVGDSPVEGFRELWQQRVEGVSSESAAAVVAFRGRVVRLFSEAEAAKRKVVTLSRWKGWFAPN